MSMRAGLSAVCLSLLIGGVGGAQVRNLPSATEDHGGFGLQDPSGSRLLLLPTMARPELLKTALCSGGHRVPVQFARRKPEGANANGRQTSRNFDKLAGSVFTVLGNPVDPDALCFLASDSLLTGSTILSFTAAAEPGTCPQPGRFATLRDRPVVHCWTIARMSPERQVVLVEFERREKDALASLVLVDGSRALFADIPAEFRGPGQDLWRVDDGGVLSPSGLKIVCALQRGAVYALGTAWAGAEGQLLSFWISSGTDRFTKVINDYWYQAPI
jgi:hypothetical protein